MHFGLAEMEDIYQQLMYYVKEDNLTVVEGIQWIENTTDNG